MKDANQLAAEAERRENLDHKSLTAAPPKPRGTLNIWTHVGNMKDGYDPELRFEDVTPPDLTRPGIIIIYDADMNASVFYPSTNAYVEFVLNREGE